MPRFSDSFLEELRAALPASRVVGRRRKLHKAGKDFVDVDDQSFTVSDAKGLIHDFGGTQFSGDIIAFEQHETGCTFEAAVETLASLAGMALPGQQTPTQRRQQAVRAASSTATNGHANGNGNGAPHAARGNGNGANWHHAPVERENEPATSAGPANGHAPAGGGREEVAAWDYTDADGSLIYQVVRVQEREADGSWKLDKSGAKPWKSFRQRMPTPHPGERGTWTWGLEPGIYGRRGPGDNYWFISRLDGSGVEDKRKHLRERIRVEDGAAHTLLHLPDLIDEMAQPADERRTIFIPEGERKVDALRAWGLVATCNSGGAKHWADHFSEHLRNADVVILADADKAGRQGAAKKAASLRGIAARIRVLDWAREWPGAPEKADNIDWQARGGTVERLYDIVRRLPDWVPEPPESGFGAVRLCDLYQQNRRKLEWLVKRIMVRGETALWYGAQSSGKSFLMFDFAMAIARGMPNWFGNRVRPGGLVVYQAGEGGLGMENRWRAYNKFHGIDRRDPIPFVLLTNEVNIFANNADMDRLVDEILSWKTFYRMPVELIVFDTLSAAISGADENASADMTLVLQRGKKIRNATGAAVVFVHHMPKGGGSPRGWSGLMGNVDSMVEILVTSETEPGVTEAGNVTRRPVHQLVTRKLKDGQMQLRWSFVLPQVLLGSDVDGDPETSCVVQPLAEGNRYGAAVGAPPGYYVLVGKNIQIMRALMEATRKHGVINQPDAEGCPEYTRCVRISQWVDEFYSAVFFRTEKDPDGKLGRAKAEAVIRTVFTMERDWVHSRHLIARSGDWVWRTTRKIHGIDDPPPALPVDKPADPLPDDAHDIGSVIADGDRPF